MDSQLNAKLADLELGTTGDDDEDESLKSDSFLVNWMAPEVFLLFAQY